MRPEQRVEAEPLLEDEELDENQERAGADSLP